MNTAQNIQELYDGGYIKQAFRMANSESVSVEYDANVNNPTVYTFPDGSSVSMTDTECAVSA